MQKLFFVSVLICSFFTLGLFGQDASGRVIGTVTDQTGAVVPNARVVVTNVATAESREDQTGSDGSYQVLLLPIGTYTVSVEAGGFRRASTDTQKLEINQSLKIDIKLEVGATTETVQVQSQAIGVETVNATLGHSVTSRQIVNAPLNGRNTLSLALLEPGVIPNLSWQRSLQRGGKSWRLSHLSAGWRRQQQSTGQRCGLQSQSRHC